MKKTAIIIKFTFYITVLLCIVPTIILSQNFDTLPSFIHDVLVDEISRNSTIDSLDKYKLTNAVWDSLQNMTSGTDVRFREGRIAEIEVDFKLIGSDTEDFLNYRSVEITVQLVYDTSEANLLDISLFTSDIPNILLSTTPNRLISSFTVNIDRNILEKENEMHQITSTEKKVDEELDFSGDESSLESRPSIYLIFINGIYQDYTFNEIEERAFFNKRLTNVSIPEGIVTIGVRSFANNRLTVINIPHSVNLIKSNAFERNRIETVSIGANVQLERNSIGRNFESFYRLNGSKAGIYVYNNNTNMWIFRRGE